MRNLKFTQKLLPFFWYVASKLFAEPFSQISFNLFLIDHNEVFDIKNILRKRKRTALADDTNDRMGKF